MMPGISKNSYGLARRPVQQGAGLEGWPNQALHDPVYWLKKKQRKHRKLKIKKSPRKVTPATNCKKDIYFNIIQANVAGIKNKRTELQKLFNEKNIHVAMLQETQHQSCNYKMSGYTPYTCNCNSCRGIITYIRKDLQCNVTPHTADAPNDILKATVWFGEKKLNLLNVYSAPKDVFTFTSTETIFKSTVIAGDFNGHSPLWGYKDQNATGTNIENLCQSSNLIRIQDEFSPPTLLHKVHGTLHRPDLTLVSADLHSMCSTTVLKDVASDHRPTLISLNMGKQQSRKRRSRWNFKKANWPKFQI